MGAYYHQDFDETGGVWGTLDLYLSEADDQRVAALLGEVDDTLQSMTEQEVADLLLGLGCSVLREGPDAYRSWLRQIRDVIKNRLVTTAS